MHLVIESSTFAPGSTGVSGGSATNSLCLRSVSGGGSSEICEVTLEDARGGAKSTLDLLDEAVLGEDHYK